MFKSNNHPDDIAASNNDHRHKRTTSSVLKSIMGPRGHKRNPSAGAVLAANIFDENKDSQAFYDPSKAIPLLPSDHPHSGQGPLGELIPNELHRPVTQGKIMPSQHEQQDLGILGKEKEKRSKSRDGRNATDDKQKKPKKSKSQTSLGALLSRPKSSRGLRNEEEDGNLQVRELQPATQPAAAPPPIYAQFASQQYQENLQTATIPLRDGSINQEIQRYTPVDYSPSKQRNFNDVGRPTLGRREPNQKPRPKSEYMTSSTAGSTMKKTLAHFRKLSNDSSVPSSSSRESSGEAGNRFSIVWDGRNSSEQETKGRLPNGDTGRPKTNSSGDRLTVAKRGSRVMAAVAVFNKKAKESETTPGLDLKEIERSFEALLDSRNVPQNMRQKMRSLDINIKADFIRKDKVGTQAASASGPSRSGSAHTDSSVLASMRPPSNHQDAVIEGVNESVTDGATPASPTKRERPRSKTFTLSKTDKESSPTKKQKPDRSRSGRVKSIDISSSGSTNSLTAQVAADAMSMGFGTKPKHAVPQDFVAYLTKVQEPAKVEVGKLHKLRLVLRNERVAWVDSFISMGGMDQVVDLLYRIMAIEWREEHEDALLHEVLLCLKALCTTALALQKLHQIQPKLFPALIHMLFDEERKGPSEFTTRGIIIGLLSTYLADAPAAELHERAKTILSYLRDPEDGQPLGFIASMHQSRPYRVWCKEVVSVTKEVFWIFLHNMNVIPLAPLDPTAETGSYTSIHFPKERPPVPAAPYVGGVEWDATNYLSTHLDLMNGLIASLPTSNERNFLRRELQLSGFEKMMGVSLRTCKEKFYGAVHDGLKTWVAAAAADAWEVKDVRFGPPPEERKTPRASPTKKKNNAAAAAAAGAAGGAGAKLLDAPPKVELPILDLDVVGKSGEDDTWAY